MGTVFLLNAGALYLLPLIGHALHLSQHHFGVWAGVAIHDITSVVGASLLPECCGHLLRTFFDAHAHEFTQVTKPRIGDGIAGKVSFAFP